MYEKQTWKNGDVITEDKLNHMEEGISTGGGIYTVENVALFDEEVTTTADKADQTRSLANITLSSELPQSDINVVFNGQNYVLPFNHLEDDGYELYIWGELGEEGPIFENYPLYFEQFKGLEYDFKTNNEAGTYSLKIFGDGSALVLDESFKNSLGAVAPLVIKINGQAFDKTAGEIYDAFTQNRVVILDNENDSQYLVRCSMTTRGAFDFYFIGVSSADSTLPAIFNFGADSRDEYPSIK